VAFTFVDLFAGIGGFHNALAEVGGECRFASEIDPQASAVYELNWGMKPAGDIIPLTEATVRVPKHDVLAAGFPCQPFSKSGFQRGMAETRGTLFWNICRVLEERRPHLVLLENVRNLAGPRHRDTWSTIVRSLRDLGYWVPSAPTVLSPHWLPPSLGGTPQVRERVFITAVHVGPDALRDLPTDPLIPKGPVPGWDPMDWDLEYDLPLDPDDEIADLSRYQLSPEEEMWIDVWDDFLDSIDAPRLPGFPIWADAFVEEPEIPEGTPRWKSDFLKKNAAFYSAHKSSIDAWLGRHDGLEALPPSRRKLEWQAQDTPRSLRNCVLHLRPSGIRAKKPTYVPALVAITQTSIIGQRGRRLTPREAARLQGLPENFDFGAQPDSATYRQLGNSVARGAVLWALSETTRQMRDYLPKRLRDLGADQFAALPGRAAAA
jgi:DNA (cytosine-5)-methyltransferase 1